MEIFQQGTSRQMAQRRTIRAFFLRLLERVVRPIFCLVSYFRRRKPIPPADDEIFHTSATVLAEKIRSKKVSED